MIENTIYQILSNITPLTDLISTKIYYENNPNQEESEYLIYQKNSHNRPLDILGSSSIESADFQIDIYSDDEDSVREIREVLISNLHGISNSQYSDNIQQIYVESEFSSFDSESDGYRIALTLSTFF